MHQDLIGILRVVAEAVVQVVVEDGRPHSERHLPPEVREQVVVIVVVPLGHSQVRVQGHPVKQVGKLAHPAAHAFAGDAVFQHHAGQKAPFRGAPAHQLPKGKGLAGADEDAVDAGGRQPQGHRLVVLQTHIYLPQGAADEGIVGIDETGQRLRLLFQGEGGTRQGVPQAAQGDVFFHRHPVGHRGPL